MKLLLADDSVTVQRVIELTFADEGMTVVSVGDGRAAIDSVERERPDIVLADLTMPERDGYEVAEHIKRTPHLAHIPVVLLTGAFEQVDEPRARAAGCDGVLAKPFEPHMVIDLVRQLLGHTAAAPQTVAESPAAAAPPSERSLDEYFDRLDEALAGHPGPRSGPRDESHPGRGSSRSTAPPEASAMSDDHPTPPAPSKGHALADAFSALLADELGEAAPRPAFGAPVAAPQAATRSADPRAPREPALASPAAESEPSSPPAPSDDFVEEVTRRVAARLGDAAVRDLVRAAVIEVAERLVREEIERIKGLSEPGGA